MKSVKKLITITIVILLNAYIWGGVFNDTISKGNISITISCKGGWIKVSPGDSKDNKFEKKLSGILFCNNRAYVQNENNTWTEKGSISITSFKEVKNKNENDKPGILKILGTGENNFNNIPKVKDILLPYSSDLGIDITEGILAIISEKEIIYVQPNCELFKFYKYDSNNFENEDTSKERQKKVMESLANDLDAKKQLDSILAHSIIESSLKENNISDLDRKNEKNPETNVGYRIYIPGNLEVNANEYLRNYLKEGPYKANAPVFSSELYTEKKENLGNYEYANGSLLSEAAKRYLNWAVEYKLFNPDTKYENPLYKDVDGVWEENGEQSNNYYKGDFPVEYNPTKIVQEEGNPVPYVNGGVDTPRTFWWKMHLQESSDSIKSILDFNYNTKSYIPGTGKERGYNKVFKLKYAGCDSIGMLSGIIGMSELDKRIPSINGMYPAQELNKITEDLRYVIKEDVENTEFDKDKYASLRYTIPDIEKITTVVPSYEEIEIGDLLVRIKARKVDIAVVIGYKNKTKDDIQIVYINQEKNGTAVKSTWGQLSEKIDGKQIDISDEFTPRRLLVKKENAAVPTEKYKDAGWDILGKQIDLDRCSIRIGTKMEQGQNQQNDKNWRFIPNTGEYLILGNLTVDLVNSAGVQLNEIYDKEYTVKQLYVKDRSFNDAEGRDSNNNILTDKGNIYINKADKIEMAYFEGSEKNVFEDCIFEITREKNGNNKTEYYKSKSFGDEDIQIRINSSGKIINFVEDKINSMPLSIGIRPESAEHAYPGDDYILGLEVSDGNNSYKVECDQKDCVAVYDKKMLWRANLYIDKQETELGNLDWNNVHPWNAPPDTMRISGTWGDAIYNTDIMWDKDKWGYNEWNRKYNLSINSNTSNLVTLEQGTGGQTVSLREYTSYRNDGTQKSGTVSYDYNTGKINAWDSPFDFIYKLNKQKKSIQEHFTSINSATSSNNYFPKNSQEYINGNERTLDQLKQWNKETAPNGRWKFYWKQKDTQAMEPFIPGLGFWGHKNYSYTGETEDFIKNISFPAFMGAGTDCIGFVKRTCYYKTNKYSWNKNNTMQYDRAEGNNKENENERTNKPLAYPDNYSNIIISRISIGNDLNYYELDFSDETLSTTQIKIFENIRKKFKCIVPGDVIYYSNSHIGEIKSIDIDAMDKAETIYDLMRAVTVIESVYNGYVFNVATRNMIQTNENTTEKDFSWHLGKDNNNDTIMRDWIICRLK